jgi:hypothetical protein
MTDPEDPALAALDAHIRAQLARAAQEYASHTDLQARLTATLEAAPRNDNGAATAHS